MRNVKKVMFFINNLIRRACYQDKTQYQNNNIMPKISIQKLPWPQPPNPRSRVQWLFSQQRFVCGIQRDTSKPISIWNAGQGQTSNTHHQYLVNLSKTSLLLTTRHGSMNSNKNQFMAKDKDQIKGERKYTNNYLLLS